MAPRQRVLAFGSATALVLAGPICLALIDGVTGEALAIALITLGLGAVVLLLFLEVGLSEERDEASAKGDQEPPDSGESSYSPWRRHHS